MKSQVLEQARERLEVAETHYEGLKGAQSYKQFRLAWTQFLLALNSVFSKLEQGAKGCNVSEPWFGSLKSARRKDPLLQYLHQARNADEHGIKPISKLEPGAVGVGAKGESVTNFSMMNGVITVGPNADGSFPTVTLYPWRAVLVEVFDDLHRDSFPPPSQHLGKPLTDASPAAVAELGLSFVKKALADATGLPSH